MKDTTDYKHIETNNPAPEGSVRKASGDAATEPGKAPAEEAEKAPATEPGKSPAEEAGKPKRKRSLAFRIARAAAWTLGGIAALIILLLTAATLWLTPERLTEIVNREASRNLYADVNAHNIRFTLWSSWPHLRLEMDSISIRSRALDSLSSLPSPIREKLPSDADFLASTGRLSGGINLLTLLRGEISLHDVEVDSLRLNLVVVNDSLANYDIIPPDTIKSRIPHFTANRVRMLKGGLINYRSLPDGADAEIALKSLSLSRTQKRKNRRDSGESRYSDTYTMRATGDVDAIVSDLSILHNFPFELDGDIDLGFDPFRFATSDYHLNLGSLRSDLDMKMQVGGDSRLDSFSWHLDSFDLLRILAYFPGVNIPDLKGVEAPVKVNATARLTSPWRLSSDVLPSAEVDFNVLGGDMRFTMADGKRYNLRHESASGRLIFDGLNPAASSFAVAPFRIFGEGVDMTIGADMTHLLGRPEIAATIEGNAMLRRLGEAFPMLRPYQLKGDVKAMATLHGEIPPLAEIEKTGALSRTKMNLAGRISLNNFSGQFGKEKINAAGKSLEIEIAGKSNGGKMPDKIAVQGIGKNIALNIPGENMDLKLGDISLKGSIDPATYEAQIALGSREATLNAGEERVAISGLSLALDADRLSSPRKIKDYAIPEEWTSDSYSMGFAAHSPEFIKIEAGEKIKNLISNWDASLRLNIEKADYTTASYPVKTEFRNIDLAASVDTIAINNIEMRSGSSAMGMRGSVTNLRQFLGSATPAPLYISMEAAMDTMQINQLAKAFLGSRKGVKFAASPQHQESDTIAMLLPRNIIADLRLTAKETRYTNLHLYDLTTGIKLRDGNLRVEDMRIYADFGHAFMNFDMTTGDIQRIGMRGDIGLLDVDVVRFFERFHSLLEMMPQMKNLEGDISVEAAFSLLSFPNMYVNVPSMNADIMLDGDGLTIHQSSFIKKITKMLLIREKGPLHIEDMRVHASLHDNLLELYPFTFAVDRYKLRMGGLNNFAGDLYYHIGVEKSPIPFKFGLNIAGKFSKPEVRFGGYSWKIKKGEEITASIMEEKRINILAEGRSFLKKFLKKAAESE